MKYEDFQRDIRGHLKSIQAFIGVDVLDLPVTQIKQETRPLNRIIENYDQLKRYFHGTQWEYLFDDGG